MAGAKVQRSGARPRKGALWLGFQDRAWQKTLPLRRRALDRPQDRRGQGADRSGPAQSRGELVSGPQELIEAAHPSAEA